MTSRTLIRAATAVAAIAMVMSACIGDPVTAPGAPDLGKGKPPTQASNVSLANLVLESTTLPIGGTAVNYTVDIVNDGRRRTVVTLQGSIYTLGTDGVVNASRAAGGTEVTCGLAGGTLPHGTCTMGFTAQASNTTGGDGTLVAGPATFTLAVLDADGSQLAYMVAPVTLQ